MENKEYILNEIREISPLIFELKKDNVYSVSPDYFNNLAENILKKIKQSEKLTYTFSSVNPYKVREGYFESFAEEVLYKIPNLRRELNEVTQELESLAPILNTINKKPVFKLPADYFENFMSSYAVKIQPQAQVISIRKKFYRYAVAAIITVLMTVGVYYIVGKNTGEQRTQALNVKSALKKIKDDEIIEFLKTINSASNITTATSEKKSLENKIRNRIKEMSEEDIKEYLQENLELGEIEMDI